MPYSVSFVEGSPERDRASGSALGMFGLRCHASFSLGAVFIGCLFYGLWSYGIGNRPHEGGELTGGSGDHSVFVLSITTAIYSDYV